MELDDGTTWSLFLMCSLQLTRAGRDQQLLYPSALPTTKSHVKNMSG